MNSILQTIHNVVNEAKDVSPKVYSELETDFLVNKKGVPELDQMAKMSKEYGKRILGQHREVTIESDDGNMVASWLENDDMIMLIGILSRSGRMTKDNYKEVLDFLDYLEVAFDKGKTLMTSPNKRSEKMLNNFIKRMKEKGKTLKVDVLHDNMRFGEDENDPELSYKSLTVKKV